MSSDIVSNQQVNLDGNFKVEDMSLHSLSPKYRSVSIIMSLVIGTIFITILLLFVIQPFFSMPQGFLDNYYIGLLIIGLLTLWSVLYTVLAFPKMKYALREFDVHYQSGLIFFRTVSQPIMRIQHIEIERGPIERSAGLSTLQVYSAGGSGHTFEIPGLEYEKAIELRQFILNHKDVSQDG
ncbi:PH domain-containing protein [Glaciecola sp. MF2-115]|uniref:PH domain-containing protein n=1 Tax=Glaciecola sp. MF2-115 TaxID=3384827 RepID=UPI00399FD285